jgi:predicted flap endonuclease-1-like 5' DNA nuclease
MSQTTIIIIAVIVVVILLLLLLLRGRKQRVAFGDQPAELPPMAPPVPKAPIATPKTPAPAAAEGRGIGDEVTAAIEDVVDQFIGLDAHPSGQEQVRHAGDALTTLKGLGPKAASRLNELGITTFAQIAAWSEADIDAIDEQMGAFKGRLRRDRWVDQAKLLAKGDIAGFEAAFGKLGA